MHKVLASAIFFFSLIAVPAYSQQTPQTTLRKTKARITAINFLEVTSKADPFSIEIIGNDFSGMSKDTVVELLTADGSKAADNIRVMSFSKTRVVVQAKPIFPPGADKVEINRIGLEIPGNPIESRDFGLVIEPASRVQEQKSIEDIDIKFELFPGKPVGGMTHFLLLVSKEGGQGEFAKDPNRMQVDILPAGASDVKIKANTEQLVIDFWGQENFEVKRVIITVFDGSDPENRNIIAIAKPFKEKRPEVDPNQPVISDTEILLLQRSKGIGRLKIEGSGFGNYDRPPMAGQDELMCCFTRSRLRYAGKPADQTTEYQKDCGTEANRCQEMEEWRKQIEETFELELVPRNPDLRVERTKILYIDDKMIDAYFEFTQVSGYSRPFRLAGVSITVRKARAKTTQTKKSSDLIATVESPEAFVVSHEVGPRKDKNLQYEFTVLDKGQANALFGRGISESFYVIQLSVTNTGQKKVAVPLATIQAEVDWAHGSSPSDPTNLEYLEGPPTLAPIPLETASAFFDAYLKSKGKGAQFFNFLQGVATLGAAVIPFVGPSFKDGHIVLTGAGIPALRQIIGDLSGQQLQNLTGKSWQNVEVISGNGGAITKYIYIQRGEQDFFSGAKASVKPNVKKEIKNILGLEVVGFEVIESEAKAASQK